MIISLDTETTGVDLAHGAMPFIVTWCEPNEGPCLFEWPVDPLTRKPEIPTEDLEYLAELLDAAELIYMHNGKFDARALATIGIQLPWEKVRDSLPASHILSSNTSHKLKDLCITYLGANINKLEDEVEATTKLCRDIAKKDHPDWLIAREGGPGMPSVKASSKRDEDAPWKNDMWLPKALRRQWQARREGKYALESWDTVAAKYACGDSEHTIYLGLELERLLKERGLWEIYLHRLEVMRCSCELETYGVTAIGEYTESSIQAYGEYVAEAGDHLRAIAKEYGHDLELAEGASLNDNMRDFFYGAVKWSCPSCSYSKRVKHWNGEGNAVSNGWMDIEVCPKCAKGNRRQPGAQIKLVETRRDNLALPVIVSGKTGNASLDKEAMREYLQTLDGVAYEFVKLLEDKRKHDTALTYMQAYQRFWLPVPGSPGFYRIHPSLNPCGTDHLRWASNSPNLQNVGKQEQRCEDCDGKGCDLCGGSGLAMLSARNCFGPAPGREWWSMDFESIEKRIPAYEAQEPALIDIFEKPNEPPYWGSDHNLLCSLLWPQLYDPIADKKGEFKKRYINEYKRAKNTNFAKQYGAGKRKTDTTAGVPGAYDLIDRGLPELAKLQQHYLAVAERKGYVETLPDRTVNPNRGYPILASRTEDGRVLSTTPFNYHVSGTACWCKNTALIRCAKQCAQWRAEDFDANIALEIHDEILFDFPRGATMQENLPRALVLKGLMEQSGADLIPQIPTPVSVEYHSKTWAEGVSV